MKASDLKKLIEASGLTTGGASALSDALLASPEVVEALKTLEHLGAARAVKLVARLTHERDEARAALLDAYSYFWSAVPPMPTPAEQAQAIKRAAGISDAEHDAEVDQLRRERDEALEEVVKLRGVRP